MNEKYCRDCEHHSFCGHPTPFGPDYCTAVRDIVTGNPIPCDWARGNKCGTEGKLFEPRKQSKSKPRTLFEKIFGRKNEK